MNNNLINFINKKMMKLDKKINNIREHLIIIDEALNNIDVLMQFTEKEMQDLRVTLYILENIYDIIRDEYKNLNIIRLNLIGLI